VKQIKNIDDPAALRALLAELGVELAVDDTVDPAGVLAEPLTIGHDSGPRFVAPNRFAILPMEGWDAGTDGRPTDLVARRWARFGASGAGLVWAEATAVDADGRANPNQLVLSDATAADFAELRTNLSTEQVTGLQLTHSGRWSRPDAEPRPRTAYRHPLLDARAGDSPGAVLSDGELDDLSGAYVAAARLASEAGFDFVDVKACHGYLLHELLSGYDRPGRYGGDLAGRSRLLLDTVREIRRQLPDLGLAVRLSIFDVVPHEPGPDGVGVPSVTGDYRFAFGGDGTGGGIDLTETHALLDLLVDAGVSLISTTAGSPYYNPHVQRPAFFPPSDGYRPPEDPLVGVARQIAATAEVTARHPEVAVVGSGYTYLQDWLAHVAQPVIASGGASMVGLGRAALSLPDLPRAVLEGRPLERKLVCRTFSDCTTAPRHGMVSGCYPLDPFYKAREERVTLAAVKKEARNRLR